ncbi:hypothetical protein Bbelb_080800 [Branchiostoma belcheri]|nr:hypothetical protein Bbelb_080800 [Branchiostoma belcheri]
MNRGDQGSIPSRTRYIPEHAPRRCALGKGTLHDFPHSTQVTARQLPALRMPMTTVMLFTGVLLILLQPTASQPEVTLWWMEDMSVWRVPPYAQDGFARLRTLPGYTGVFHNIRTTAGKLMEEKEKELRDAVIRGEEDRVKQLLAEGVNVNAVDNRVQVGRWTALDLASVNGHTGIVQALLTAGATVNARNFTSYMELLYSCLCAARKGHTGTVQALLTVGAEIDARDNDANMLYRPDHRSDRPTATGGIHLAGGLGPRNDTPLHHAAKNGHPECVRVLLWAGANTVNRNSSDKTAEDLAVQEDVQQVFQVFKDDGLLTINLSNKGLTSLPAELFDIRDVECLVLSNNRLTSIPEEIGQLQKLQRLELDNNLLTQLPQAITTLPNLHDIDLSDNKLETLPDGFSRLKQLQSLNIQNNVFKEIPEEVWSLHLKFLDIGGNPLKCLPDKISQLTELTQLRMNYCQFDEFPRQVLQLKGLEGLHMGHWAGEGKPSLVPEDIGRLKNLQYLRLHNSGLESLPDGVGELVQLEVVDISDNRFTSVPEQIMNLSNIRKLNLSGNRISHIQMDLGQLDKLDDMDIINNPLIYPPPDVCTKGTAAIMDFLRRELRKKEGKFLGKLFFRFSQNVTQSIEVEALAAVAGLTANERTSILGKDKTNPRYQANNVLLKWIEKDHEASMDKLQQELSDIGMDQLAQEAGRIKAERLKRPADTSGGPPAKRPAAGGSSGEGHQEEQQTKEKIRQAEQKLVQMQHHSETQEAMVHSLRAEVTRLRDKEEQAQKVLLDHKLEIQQLQEANVAMATRVDDLLQDNEKLRSQVVLLGGKHADEQTTQVLEQTILMFTENVLEKCRQSKPSLEGGEEAEQQKSRQSKPTLKESELATAAGKCVLIAARRMTHFWEGLKSRLLTKLSCRLGSDWRRLGAGLGVPQPRLDSIQAQYNSAIQRACRVLQVWMWGGRHALPHDLKQLETVLKDMDRPDLLDIVKTAFKAAYKISMDKVLDHMDRTDLLDIVKTAYKDYIEEMPEVEVEPDASVDEQGVTTWSVQLPGRGKFLCKHTDLGVVTPCPVQLTYRTVNPSEHWPESEDWELIGPLFHIQCNHGDDVPVELLLPHILDLSQEDSSALTTDDVRAAHVVAGNTTLHSAEVTHTHCITRHRKGCFWSPVMQRIRALIWPRRGLLTLFKTSQTHDTVEVKAVMVSNTKDSVKFYWWDSITCPGLRAHQIYCLQASVEHGTLDLADPEPPSGLEYEDTLDSNRIYPSFHLNVKRHLDSGWVQLNLQLYPAETEDNGGAEAGPSESEDVRRHFFFIKENISTNWINLAHFLGFARPAIDTIQYKPANRDAKDCCMDMLEQWRTRGGNAATLQVLLQALTEAGLQDTVDQLNTM